MMRKPFLALVVSAALVAAVFAAADKPASVTEPVTVGDFAVRMAAAIGSDASSPKAAAEALRAQGVGITDELEAPVTEGMAAQVLADLGMKAQAPADPNTQITSGAADRMATAVGLSAAVHAGPEWSSGISAILACLHSQTQAACVDCCKAATKCGIGKKSIPCLFCTLICRLNQPPPPSPGAPHK